MGVGISIKALYNPTLGHAGPVSNFTTWKSSFSFHQSQEAAHTVVFSCSVIGCNDHFVACDLYQITARYFRNLSFIGFDSFLATTANDIFRFTVAFSEATHTS